MLLDGNRLAFPVKLTLDLECPFAWKEERYLVPYYATLFPVGMNLTISFTATRISKILGYIPFIGTVIGIYRIYKGIEEYNFFKQTHKTPLSDRGLCWIARGALEVVPVFGGIACVIADIAATILSRNNPETLCL